MGFGRVLSRTSHRVAAAFSARGCPPHASGTHRDTYTAHYFAYGTCASFSRLPIMMRPNESFDSLARLIHDTGVACNLQSYPTDSKWSFTYEPYGASDESARGLGAETDQANGAQLRNSSTYKGEIVDFRRGSKPDSRGRVQTACPSGLSQTLDHLVASEVLYLVHISTLTMWTHARSKRGATVTKI